MTQIHWANPINGGFTNASDWSGGVVPGAGDDAILDAPGSTPYTVTASSGAYVSSIRTAANATLEIKAGTFVSAGGDGSEVNAGAITVADGAVFSVSGTLANSGAILFQGTKQGADLKIGAAGLTLTGGGQVDLADSLTPPFQPSPAIYAIDRLTGATGSTLTNIDNTIVGAGELGEGTFQIVNEAKGLINASLVDDLIVNSARTLINRGTIEATGVAGLYFVNSTIDNSAGGVIAANGGIIYTEPNDVIIGGTLTSSGTGYFYLDHGATILDGFSAGSVTSRAYVVVTHDATLTLEGAIDNLNEIKISTGLLSSTLIVGAEGATLTGGGSVVLGGSDPHTAITGAALANVDDTISGQGQIGAGSLTLVNQAAGVIDANESLGLVLNTGATAVVNAGLIEATRSGGLIVRNTAIDSSGGGFILAGNGSHVALQGADLIGGTLKSVGTGAIKTFRGASNLLDGTTSAVHNEARVIVQNSTSLTLQGAIVNTNQISLASLGSATTLTIGTAGATLSGGGQVILNNNVQNIITGSSGAATLTNVDNSLNGAGQLGLGSLTLINEADGEIVGSRAVALTIDTGANTIVNAGRIIAEGAGGVIIKSAVESSGVLEVTGGVMSVNGAVSGTGAAVIVGGTLDFASTFSQKVVFRGATGVLELGRSQSYAGLVVGFSTAGATSLDLRDIGFVSSTEATFSGTASGGTLTVTDGSHIAHIALSGDYTASTFTASSDGQGGVTIVDRAAPAAAAHQFVAAAASLGAEASGPVSAAHEAWRAPPPMLARPGVMAA